jgi:hypothetical protein
MRQFSDLVDAAWWGGVVFFVLLVSDHVAAGIIAGPVVVVLIYSHKAPHTARTQAAAHEQQIIADEELRHAVRGRLDVPGPPPPSATLQVLADEPSKERFALFVPGRCRRCGEAPDAVFAAIPRGTVIAFILIVGAIVFGAAAQLLR